MPEPKPLRADARRNRDAIVAAARTAFDRGQGDRRFDDFATLAGVGTGTLYRHFPTRAALVDAVYEDEVAALRSRAQHLLATLPAIEALTAFLRDFVAHVVAHEGLAATLSTLMRDREEAAPGGGRALDRTVTELVAAASRDGDLDPALTPGAVMIALHGIGASRGRDGWQDDARALVDALVRRNG